MAAIAAFRFSGPASIPDPHVRAWREVGRAGMRREDGGRDIAATKLCTEVKRCQGPQVECTV